METILQALKHPHYFSWGGGNLLSIIFRLIHYTFSSGIMTGHKYISKLKKIGITNYFAEYTPNATRHLTQTDCYQLKKRNSVCIYTVITGTFDTVQVPLFITDDADYILFTDNSQISSDFWNVRIIANDLSHRILAKDIKIRPHKYIGTDYDTSIYIDGNILIYGNICELLHCLNNDICFLINKHRYSHSTIEEIESCLKCGKINHQEYSIAKKQYEQLVLQGFEDNKGMFETGVLIRRHNLPNVIDFDEEWWHETSTSVLRDQFHIMTSIWKTNFSNWGILYGNIYENQYWTIVTHNT